MARAANEMRELHGIIISETEDFERQKAEINNEINNSVEDCSKEQEEVNSKVRSQTGRILK